MLRISTKMLNLCNIMTQKTKINTPSNLYFSGKTGCLVIGTFLQVTFLAIMHFDKFLITSILSVTFSWYLRFIDIREFL